MNNDLSAAGDSVETDKKSTSEEFTELSEDMEMVSPGTMLREARKALSLSQEHIANKLNFKIDLVKNIEKDVFDPNMPATFNRGYLANYAKLVSVEVEDVLASYDALDAASIQRSEMLSFSKETSKQAEHSRVMWLSYFIIAVLFGLTVLWWQQQSNHQESAQLPVLASDLSTDDKVLQSENSNTTETKPVINEVVIEQMRKVESTNTSALERLNMNQEVTDAEVVLQELQTPQEPLLSKAVFTFRGDCWVNIYDATGKRIAWGVKKAGYVMAIQGKAPLRVTVGKPELTRVVFNDEAVDMSPFNVGNIAKFTLPVVPE
jgi:cytoskeleton protein RodZ